MAREMGESVDKALEPNSNMKTITVVHGVSRLTREVEDTTTFGDIRQDATIRAALGTSENVRVLLDGTPMGDAVQIPNVAGGIVVRLETAANTKATLA